MNENNLYAIWFLALITIMWAVLLAGCVTDGYLGENGRDAIRTVTRLEEQLSSIDRGLEEATRRSEDLEGNLGIFEQQFRVYVEGVRKMRSILDEYKKQTEGTTKQNEKVDNSID